MGFLARRLIKQDLQNVQVLVNDTANEYFNVVEVPTTFTQGRSAFKIFGSRLLKTGVPLKMEMLDNAGNTVFISPVDLVGEEQAPFLPYRFVTVEVYRPPINKEGLGTLTILGEINPNAVNFNIPSQFQNTYNVKYEQKINLDLSTSVNSEPIRFFKSPFIQASEIVKPRIVLTPVTQSTQLFTSGSATTSPDLKGKSIAVTTGSQEREDDVTPYRPTLDIEKFTEKFKFKTGLYGGAPPIIKRRGAQRFFASKEEPPQTITIPKGNLSSKMAGGTLTIPSHTTTIKKTDGEGRTFNEEVSVPEFQAKVKEVINDSQLVLDTLPTFDDPDKTDHKIVDDFTDVPLTMSFDDVDRTIISSSVHQDSFLDLTIKNLRTFSGDVYRIKVHGKMQSQNSGFAVLADTVIESPELLRDDTSISGFLRTGYFLDQNHINSYWTASSFDGNVKSNNVAMTHTGSQYIDSLHLSGSTAGVNQSIVAETHPDYPFILEKDIIYTLSAKIKGQNTSKFNDSDETRNTGKLYFHLSGSNLNGSKKLNTNTYLGAELTDNESGNVVSLELDDTIKGIQDFNRVEHSFQPLFNLDVLRNIDTQLQIRATSGEWHISDLSLRPAQDTGFSPDEYNIIVPLPRTQRPDKLDLFIEYFDINSNTVETITTAENVDISGSAFVIDGLDNLLTGSMFMGNVEGSGIEMAGVNSAFVRSVGYQGFQSASAAKGGGFLLFSGSVLPDAPDDYKGAGLEIHDGNTGADESYLRFRTEPSILDIKTKTFFLGSETAGNFISGSNGLIEITSSNFHLQPDGDVVLQGTITAEAGGTIGGFSIGSDNLTATDFVLNTTDKALSLGSGNTIFIADADDGIQLGNATFASAPFSVTPAGVLKAESGTVGGFTLSSTALTGGSSGTTVALTPGTGIHLGNANFGSAPFSVTNAGVIKSTSGTIGGFTLTTSTITGSNLIIDASGELRSKNYDPNLSGWLISARDNGFAEFENVKIRGTLRTAVFEKETVNAVGGQLYIANSTAITGSSVTPSTTAIQVDNVSGFVPGEIIFAKKVTGTGFTKEFMKVFSASREDSASDDNFSGFLHVTRSFGTDATGSAYSDATTLDGAINSTQTSITLDSNSGLNRRTLRVDDELMAVSSSVGSTIVNVRRGVSGTNKASHSDGTTVQLLSRDAAIVANVVNPAESYDEGQVLVSTGRFDGGTGNNTTGSGFIHINANPGENVTPYIDFAERTGSGIYDSKLRLRIGDLTGIVGSRLGDEVDITDNPGFGLASENVFLSGLIKANSGSIGGIRMESSKIFTGAGVFSGSSTGFFADSSGRFSLKNKISYDDTTSNLLLSPDTFTLSTSTMILDSTTSSGVIKLGSSATNITETSNTGLYMDGTGKFRVGTATSGDNYLHFNGSRVDIAADTFDLKTTPLRVSSSNGGTIALGSTAPTDLSSDGIFLTGSGDFNFQKGTSFIRGTSAGLEMNYPSFSVDTGGTIQAQGASIAGTITAESGEIGSGSFRWQIDGDKIINSAESNFAVEMNAGEGTEGFFLTSGSKQAQIVPEFTPSAQVLGGGGSNTFNFTGGTEGSTYGQEIVVGHNSSAQTSASFGYNNGETTFVVGSSDPNNGATLTSGTKYKSTAVIGLKSLVSLSNGGEVSGNVTVSGNIQLINNDNSDAVIETHTIDTTLPHDFLTVKTANITVNTIHTPSSNHKYYWKLNSLTVTNNNLIEEYVVGPKTLTNNLNNTFDVFFKQSIHTPQNNLTEMAPGGFQAVFLSDSTLENSPNAYFKVDGAVSNQVDILGEATITGSLVVESRNSTQKTTIAGGTLTSTQTITGNKLVSSGEVEVSAGSGIEFGTVAEIHHASSLLKFFAGNQSTLDMTLSDAGALSTRGDITAFATSITSDKRFKTNIIPITNSLDKIKKLKGVEFDWYKEYDGEGHDIGFIAQEVREVSGLEPLVKESENLRLGDKSLNVSYSKLIPVLVEAIKEQQEQIDELKKKLEES